MRFLLGLVLPLIVAALPAHSETRVCPGSETVVVYDDYQDFLLTCNAAAKTVTFFKEIGFAADTPMMIAVRDRVVLEGGLAGEAFGQCDPASGYIEVLSYRSHAKFRAESQAFGVRLNPALHESIVVHEVAHALAAIHFSVIEVPLPVHEYVAYVAQIATLPERVRRTVLRRYPVTGFTDDLAINLVNYFFEPQGFGVRAYKHFVALRDRRMHLARLFSGESLAFNNLWNDI